MKFRILSLLLFAVLAVGASAQYEPVQRPPTRTRTTPARKPDPLAGYRSAMKEGRRLYDARKYEQALAKFQAVLKSYPSKKSEINPWIDKTNARIAERREAARRERELAEQRQREEEARRRREEEARLRREAESRRQEEQAQRTAILDRLVSNMVRVEGGTFTMGATAEQGNDAYDWEKPAHRVTVSSFSIGRYEVTQEEWEAVMGSNPSYFRGASLPVESVSWDDCQEFIRRLNQLTGKSFRLPTEAEWEFAARGGIRGRGFKYSGSGDIGSVAWYDGNSGNKTHAVGGRQENELGLYDMSGNVREWCSDWYGSYGSSSQTNPAGPSTGSYRVSRGGSWSSGAGLCRVSRRGYSHAPDYRDDYLGLRLALSEESTMDPLSAQREAILDRLISNMVRVEGGTFTMGATAEQGKEAWDSEKPAHRVTVSSFSIGKYEVTQEEWEAVMGSNPSEHKGARLPVENVSWNDCQAFIRELNQLTGKSFRLPTEAEWEFAARGGIRSRGFKYSGSGDIGSVAWYDGNSGNETHAVGGKQANELGLYDMSGNVWEWCSDWYRSYGRTSRTNPTGPSTGSYRVGRGGGWGYDAGYCRVSLRSRNSPGRRSNDLGLRLAL